MTPSRSDHQVESGFPMISLTPSSSKSGSIGRRNGNISSKLMIPSRDGSRRNIGIPMYGGTGQSGRFLPGFPVFGRSFLRPFKLRNGLNADFPYAPPKVGSLDC